MPANIYKKIFFLVPHILFIPAYLFASTSVTEDIVADTVWSENNSPYIIENDISIAKDKMLTIEAGVTVKLENNVSVYTEGDLKTLGTDIKPVYFTAIYDSSGSDLYNDCDEIITPDTTGPGLGQCPNDNLFDEFVPRWGGLNILYGGTIDFINTKLIHSKEGIFGTEANITFNKSNITESGQGILGKNSRIVVYDGEFVSLDSNAILGLNGSSVYLSNTYISDIGDDAVVIFNKSTLEAENININNVFGSGVQIFSSSTAKLASTTISGIKGFGHGAVSAYTQSTINVSDSTFADFTSDANAAIILNGGTLNGANTHVSNGQSDGIVIYNQSNLTLKNSEIRDFATGIIAKTDVRLNLDRVSINNNDNGLSIDDDSTARDLAVSNSSIYNNLYHGVKNESNYVLNIINTYWGDASGPQDPIDNASGLGDEIFGKSLYRPWLFEDPTKKAQCCSSIIFLPGLQASRLYKKNLLTENQLWEPNINADVEKLYLDTTGKSIDPDIYTRDIIKSTNVGFEGNKFNIYKSFSELLDGELSAGKIASWRALPYDWRHDLDDLVSNGTKYQSEVKGFISEIENMASTSKTGKISIVAHSSGGLLAKKIVMKLESKGKGDLIDKLVLIASPQLGTPVVVAGLLHGDEQDLFYGLILNKGNARGLAENMPSAYNLLPSEKYFSRVSEAVIKFDPTVDTVNNFRTVYGDTINTASELNDFLLGTKDNRTKPTLTDIKTPNVLNNVLLNKSKITHSSIDNWTPPSNIEVVQIAGWGVPTYKGVKYFAKEECLIGRVLCTNILDRRPILTLDGDKTVVSPSATALSLKTYYADIREYNENNKTNLVHATILENTSINTLIKNILEEASSTLPLYISETKPIDGIAPNIEVSVHSPVSIDVYDELGNHTGLTKNTDPNSDMDFVEEKIPNSSYTEYGEGKYVNLDPRNKYSIKLSGLDIGTFTLETKTTLGDSVQTSNIFSDIPVNADTKGELILSATSSSLAIDVEGDGKVDLILRAGQELGAVDLLKILKKTIGTFAIDNKIKEKLYKKIDDIIKAIEKGKLKNTLTKIKKFDKSLQSRARHEKRHILSKDETEAILKIINQLLDNLK